jgi:hypothetical protein
MGHAVADRRGPRATHLTCMVVASRGASACPRAAAAWRRARLYGHVAGAEGRDGPALAHVGRWTTCPPPTQRRSGGEIFNRAGPRAVVLGSSLGSLLLPGTAPSKGKGKEAKRPRLRSHRRLPIDRCQSPTMSDDSDGHRQCRRRGANVQQELDAAMALADMAGVGPGGQQQRPQVRL